MRMREDYLPDFLKDVKKDFLKRKEYFSVLKINSKFISMCKCPGRFTHAYCASVKVLRNKQIFCESCKGYYRLQLSKEKMISPQTIRTLVKLTLLYIILQTFIFFVGRVDNFMKSTYQQDSSQ